MRPAVETHALTRRFGGLVAVDHLDLTIPDGEVYGLLGRNGAGKTTAIRMLLGLIRPDAGTVRLLGRAVDAHGGPAGPWAAVGYLVEGPGLYPELTTRDHLAVAARYRRIDPRRVDDVVARLALGPYLDVRARALSLGNRQRLALALALAHRPRLLVLDEPSNGLDPAGMVEVRELVRRLGADGRTTVFLSSHLLGEVSAVCDGVTILRRGALVVSGSVSEVLARASGQAQVRVRVDDPAAAVGLLASAGIGAAAGPDGAVVAASGAGDRVNQVLAAGGLWAHEIVPVRPDLERAFLDLTEEPR